MRPETQRAIVRRILAQIEARTTDMDERDVVLDARRYHDPERLRREEALLARHPVLAAHVAELARPGDLLAVDAGSLPILLTRGDDGELRAFVNVCRHRGTRLCADGTGSARALVCPYHGWSYRLDGRLLHVPHEEGFPTLARESSGLVPLPVAVSHGLVWVTPSPGAQAALPSPSDDPLVGDDIAGLALASHVPFDRRRWRRAMNWKVALDGFCENYHIRVAHRDSIYPSFVEHAGLFESLGPHIRLVAPRRSIATLTGTPEEGWALRQHAVLVYYLFPNAMLLVEPDHVVLITFHPHGTDETWIDQVMLVPSAPENDKARAYWEKNLSILLRVFDEDFTIGESIQRGVRANPGVRLGRFEKAIVALHAAIDREIA